MDSQMSSTFRGKLGRLIWDNINLVDIAKAKCLKILKEIQYTNTILLTMFSFVLILGSITTTHFEVKYCDFILYSNVSVAHIERIYKDANLQEKKCKI